MQQTDDVNDRDRAYYHVYDDSDGDGIEDNYPPDRNNKDTESFDPRTTVFTRFQENHSSGIYMEYYYHTCNSSGSEGSVSLNNQRDTLDSGQAL